MDERQYVGLDGQQWTTLDELRLGHRNRFSVEEPGVHSFTTEPKFAIGQRAFVVETPAGNMLWDCFPVLDDQAIEAISDLGGVAAIAISHPHYYATCVEWSRTFGDVPIYLHAADREWVTRPDPSIHFWDGETMPVLDGLTLIRCGGHFEGGMVLHRSGLLFSGDIVQVVPDRRWVSFMYSYPNLIPLGPRAIHRIEAALEPFEFDRIYGAFPQMTVSENGKRTIARSAARYLRAIQD